MDGVNIGTILSREQFRKRITNCDEQATGKHIVIVGKTCADAMSFKPEPPFICYSILRVERMLGGADINKWFHICFTSNEAAHVAVIAKERMKIMMAAKKKEMQKGHKERMAALEADLELDLDDGEDLGTITAGNEFPDD